MQIEMQGINKSFGSNPVLSNAGFQLADGEIHALMGENGAGKSTLMKILTGVYTRDDGIVKVDGREVAQQPELMGSTAVETACKLMAGEEVEKSLPVEVSLITAENAE